MAKKDLPVYQIDQFSQREDTMDFYANGFIPHAREHHFIHIPHKHDFYLVVLFTKGTGSHEIDFNSYPIRPGYLFLLSPGQTHNWKLSADIDGYIFFHTREFYDLAYTSDRIGDYPFYSSIYAHPLLTLKQKGLKNTTRRFREILEEYEQNKAGKFQKIRSLIALLYIEFMRLYPAVKEDRQESIHYRHTIKKLQNRIETHFKTVKSAGEYAGMLNISEKHLNRICNSCLGKTTTEIITDRVILEAKRLLVQGGQSVSQVSFELGYMDNSYFSRLFKKKCGETPVAFIKRYR